MKKRCTAIILAAGSGRRMHSDTAKQFMLLNGKPLIYYALQTVEMSAVIDDCVLVTGAADLDYVQKEIVEQYHFTKVQAVIPGGSERWESVAFAVKAIAQGCLSVPNRDGYLFIHDGARPFLNENILEATYRDACKYKACVAAVPSKDTVKITDENGFAVETPNRKQVWIIQTPQVFETALITDAYGKLQKLAEEIGKEKVSVTDDAGVVEQFADAKVKMTAADYRNIKITTPEDLQIAEQFLREQ